MKVLSRVYNALIFLFLYAPIVLLIVFSFNDGKSRVEWKGFTLRWYESLFDNELILKSLRITLTVAIIAAVVATVIGTAAAVGMYGMNKRLRHVFLTVNNLPMVNPEVVTGVSLMLLASRPSVVPVQGATMRTSNIFLGPIGSTSVKVKSGACPVSSVSFCWKSAALPNRVSICAALNDKMGVMSIPRCCSPSICPSRRSKVQKEPVTASPTDS